MNRKRTMGKRIALWLLSMVMVLMMCPTTAYAVNRDEPFHQWRGIVSYEQLKDFLSLTSDDKVVLDDVIYARLECDIIQEDNLNLNSLVCGGNGYVLDLNGYTLMRTAQYTTDHSLIQVGYGGGLRVIDTVGGGKIIAALGGANNLTEVFAVSGYDTPLVIEGGYFESLNGSAITTYGGKTDIRGGTFHGNTYTVNMQYGEITFNGGVFLEPEKNKKTESATTCYMVTSDAGYTMNAATVYGKFYTGEQIGQHLGAGTHIFKAGTDATEALRNEFRVEGTPIVFGKVGTEQLTSASAQISDPIAHTKTELQAISGDSTKYDVYLTQWLDETTGNVSNIRKYSFTHFEQGHVYRPILTFEPKEGYSFAADAAFFVNGEKYTAIASEKPVVDTVSMESLEPLFEVIGTYQEPAIGAKPSFDVNVASDTDYTACIASWKDNTTNKTYTLENVGDYKFECGHEYTATVKVTPAEGYCEAPFTSYTFNGSEGISKTYLPKIIQVVNIIIEEPSGGAKPSFRAVTDFGAGYRVSSVEWYDNNKSALMSEDDVFVKNGQYMVKIEVMPDTDLSFADECNIYLNDDNNFGYSSRLADGSIIFIKSFDNLVEETIEITNVDIKVNAPVAGGHLDFNVPVLSHINSKAEGTSVKWYQYDSPYQQVGADHVIDKDMRYAYQATFYTEDGYQFADNVTVTLNGNPLTKTNMKAMFSTIENYVGSEYRCNQMSVNYVFTPAEKEQDTPAESPVISSLSSNATGVQVTWGAVDGVTQYRVFYKTATGAWTTFANVKGTSTTVTGLKSGTTYSFLVRCLSADGKTYTDTYDAAKSKSHTYIAQPAVSSLSNTSTGVEVKWNAVGGAAQYRVFYKAAGGAWTGYKNTTANSMVVTGLTKGTTYSFTVRCVSADGKTYTSTYDTTGKSIVYQPAASSMLEKPEITALNSNATGVQVTWGAVSSAAQYRVFYKTAIGAWTTFANVKGTSTTVTGLTSGTTYTFLVRCLSEDAKSYTSDYDAAKSKSHTYIAQPAVSSLSNTSTGVEVKWNAVGGAAQYRVFYKAAGGAWTGYKNTSGNSMVVTGLTKGTTYSFTVRCVSADGKTYTSTYDTTGKSIVYQPAASTMLAKPEITALSSNSAGVNVTWGAVSGAAQYRVFYKTATGAWTTFGNTTGTSLTVTGLTSGTTYSFLVRCLSADGKAYTSDYDAAMSKSHTYIAQPVVSSVTNTSAGVEVKWNAVGGAAQYRVFYKAAGGAWTGYKNTTGTGMTVTGLTKGTTYSFTVRCVSADGKSYTSTYDTTGKTITVN